MIDTFLFDLDGTLLHIDLDLFVKIYYSEMSTIFSNLVDPFEFYGYVWLAASSIAEDDSRETNENKFINTISKMLNADANTCRQLLEKFYNKDIPNISKTITSEPLMVECIHILKEKGYKLVVATNPVLPRKIIHHKMKLAGLDWKDFSYISTMENSHFCKPNVKYFGEILNNIKKEPQKCIMVGNNVQEDLIASQLNIENYLIIDNLINTSNIEIMCKNIGTYKDFYEFARKINSVEGNK